ncbi:acyl-CoA dehydrogenase family protein [Rhodospirillum centenum]|uniref:Acyl-CoA dehydrogenase n=1 Tax=Rhodospirillum centenum (strain ATCC 51521 / SW) TaxID=414684 RepID=B6IX67_RHOCS|nr:acyl-CoA dehydrogenase family protein [Rhodospirillum centenum]ACJ00891.1 acyl-CoA dehydrogenase [Rhodospirillum centenum SW]
MLFTQEHKELSRTVEKFVATELNPYVDQWEEEGIFPAHEVFKKLGDAGLLGITKPTEYGGLGLDFSYAAVAAEAYGTCRAGGVPMAIGVHTDMATPALARFGSDELRREFLPPMIAGDQVWCLGVSEPGAGSDVASVKTTARKDGDDYVINGGKMWTTSGTQADVMCLLANTSDGAPHKNKSLIVLPMKTKGVTVARKLDKLGMRCSDTAQIHFEDVRVPRRYLIGEEGMGFTYQMLQFQEERMWGAAGSLRSMDIMIDDVVAYTRNRIAFGKPLIDNQYIHFRLAELKAEVEALRALTYRAVETFINGKDATMLASMAKLKSGRLLREVADGCLQYYGGMGYMNEMPISRYFRDSRLTSIGGGADEVMLSIICKYMGTLPKVRFGTDAPEQKAAE